jgi:hypothetical protein
VDRHADAAADLRRAVLETPGVADRTARQAAFTGHHASEPLASYLDKVRDASYRMTDADVDGLRTGGLSEDAVFELTLAAVLGAAGRRLDAGLRALREAG